MFVTYFSTALGLKFLPATAGLAALRLRRGDA
jgi:hypothetical protein